MSRRATLLLACLTLLYACKKAPESAAGTPQFSLSAAQVAVGERPQVSFTAPLRAEANQNYWITLVRAGSEDSAWGSWQLLTDGATQAALPAPDSPGDWEVRLHDLYPRHSFKVIQRQALLVTGEAAPAAAVQAAEGGAPTPESAIQPGPPGPAPVANASATKHGPHRLEVRDALPMRRAARDGGGHYDSSPLDGRKFLLVSFPQLQERPGKLSFDVTEIRLVDSAGREQAIHSVTTMAANPLSEVKAGRPLRFETEIAQMYSGGPPPFPITLAFDVPVDSRNSWLKVGNDLVELNY